MIYSQSDIPRLRLLSNMNCYSSLLRRELIVKESEARIVASVVAALVAATAAALAAAGPQARKSMAEEADMRVFAIRHDI